MSLWQRWSLRRRLMVLLGVVMLLCQSVSVIWVWHESQEQVGELVKLAHNPARSLRELEKEQRETVSALLFPNLLMTLLALGLVSLAVSWLTAPLAELVRLLHQRSVSNLKPLQLQGSGSEIGTVVQAINDLLTRLEMAVTRERQFTADVAHELRTPLAGIRLSLELMQDPERDSVVGPLIQRLDGLHHTVEQLLQMARLERNLIMGVSDEVYWRRDVFTPLLPELTQMLQHRQQRLRLDANEQKMTGEAALLQMLIRNLVENAGRYADAGSEVVITLRAEGEGAQASLVLSVSDLGPGIPQLDPEVLMRPFTRLDSRGPGVGLGLSIVARICEIHRANISFESRTDPSGLTVVVRFPLHGMLNAPFPGH